MKPALPGIHQACVLRLRSETDFPCVIDRRRSAARNCRIEGRHRAVFRVSYVDDDGVVHTANLCANTAAAVCHQLGIAFPPGPGAA